MFYAPCRRLGQTQAPGCVDFSEGGGSRIAKSWLMRQACQVHDCIDPRESGRPLRLRANRTNEDALIGVRVALTPQRRSNAPA
jgi:hypothetical protein